ncbi:MAG TPA: ATP-binding protein [Blastocatellia bacterium]|nr:ATP-binding protein [Blastocatellia bacterium]
MKEYRDRADETTDEGAGREERDSFIDLLEEEIDLAGGEWQEDEESRGSVGFTMYDTPASKDNTVTVLLPADQIGKAASQSLVRIKSKSEERGGDGRQYLGAVVQGPFAEPDGLRADAPLVVTTTVRGARFMPRYHGRVQVEILGEEVEGTLVPPRFRPLPNSPVFALDQEETKERLKLGGDVTLGLAVGYEDMSVALPSTRKDVFPRHTGILGTTGGGKSTTVSGLVGKLSESGVGVVVFDTEGEYTRIMEPAGGHEMREMLAALERRGIKPKGVGNVAIRRLIGRESTNKDYADNKEFSLEYSNISPYAMIEILNLNEAQQDRFDKAYEITRRLLMDLKIFPKNDREKDELLELDELERGFPRMTLQHMYDIVRYCADTVAKEEKDTYLGTPEFHANRAKIANIVAQTKLPNDVRSWRKVQGSLARLLRLGIFDDKSKGSPDYDEMTQPGRVTVIDLSDTESPQVNNLVISEILRGLHQQQDRNYRATEEGAALRRVVVIVEEAHEFLSTERIKQMPVLFQQVARIARRGRKRWLGLTFVTQLPQHLPDEVLGLINNYVLHKIADSNVISRLKRSVGGVDESLWNRLPNLAPGQAIVSASSIARPLLVAIDPTPSRLRMIE